MSIPASVSLGTCYASVVDGIVSGSQSACALILHGNITGSITASLIGISFAVVALLVLVRKLELKDVVRLVKRGLLAIFAFVVLGALAQMFLPGFLTAGFVACARTSLLLGVAIVVVALALMLIASHRQSGGAGHNKH